MTPAPRSPGVVAIDVARLAGLFTITLAIGALALSVLPALVGGPRPVLIESGSMAPAVRPGDIVLVSEPPSRITPGSIITFASDDGRGRVTHRVVSVDADGRYRTQGDANPTEDSAPVDPNRIEGSATVVVPLIGRPALWWSNRNWAPLGLTLLVALGAVGTLLLPPPSGRRNGIDASSLGSMAVSA